MPPQPPAYSTTTSKAVMEQVSKEGLTILQVESWDAIQAAILGRKIILEGGSEKVERESDHCIFEDCVHIYICLFKYVHALCMIDRLTWLGGYYPRDAYSCYIVCMIIAV